MKKRIFAILLAVLMCVCFAACGSSDEEGSSDQDQANAKQTEQTESTDAPIVKGLKYEDFLGTWETTTEKANEYFGGYKITFYDDMTFEAVVTGEEETGTCAFENSVVTVHNEVLNDQFKFNEKGTLIVYGESGAMSTLTKVE